MSVLSGVRIVEVGAWVAGPSASAVLADWGADVIKIETPTGDPFRHLFSALGYDPSIPNAPFALDNRAKRSIVLDLGHPHTQPVLERLLDSADAFVTNMRPDALDRLGIGSGVVTERYPRLVYCLITGYGTTGPDRDRPGYDVGAFWARSGLAHLLAPPGDPPPAIRGGLGDHATALGAAAGILAALFERERTGRGQVVETSLLRTGAFMLGWDLGIQLALGRVAPTVPRDTSPTPLLNSYQAKDGHWFFLMGLEADRHFPGLLRAIDRVDLADDARFATATGRRRNSAALIAVLDSIFGSASLSEWAARFDREDVWWAAVQTPEEVLADPQFLAAGGLVEVAVREGEPFQTVASPVEFDGQRVARSGPVPQVGEHTREILLELGFDDTEVARLVDLGVVTL